MQAGGVDVYQVSFPLKNTDFFFQYKNFAIDSDCNYYQWTRECLILSMLILQINQLFLLIDNDLIKFLLTMCKFNFNLKANQSKQSIILYLTCLQMDRECFCPTVSLVYCKRTKHRSYQ